MFLLWLRLRRSRPFVCFVVVYPDKVPTAWDTTLEMQMKPGSDIFDLSIEKLAVG